MQSWPDQPAWLLFLWPLMGGRSHQTKGSWKFDKDLAGMGRQIVQKAFEISERLPGAFDIKGRFDKFVTISAENAIIKLQFHQQKFAREWRFCHMKTTQVASVPSDPESDH